MLEGMIDPDYHGEIGLPLQNGSKKDYVWSTGNPLGCLLVIPYPVIKINGKLQQPNPGRMPKVTGPPRMKVRVTPVAKEPESDELLTEGGGNAECIVEEAVLNTI